MAIYEKINQEIKESMLSKNKVKLDVLRMMKTKVMTVDARGELPDSEIIKILDKYVKSLKDAKTMAEQNNKLESAKELQTEIEIVDAYLPQKLSEHETEALVKTVISQTGATAKKDIGIVMKAIMASGKSVDNALVKQFIDKNLV